jgi:predicted transcriptional regulator of viral defense system
VFVQPIRQLGRVLANLDSNEECLFSLDDLAGAMPGLSRGALKALVGRAVTNGLLRRVCHGVYCVPQAAPSGLMLFHTAAKLRADAFNYLSLESVLSDAGVISQVPINWITVMSSGRSQVVRCGDLGTIEFVHTKKLPADLAADLVYDVRCHLWRASVALALRDIKATRRNLELIDWDVANELV